MRKVMTTIIAVATVLLLANGCSNVGKTTYEAEPIVDSFLDKLFYQKKQYGYIVHGHGTGKLRNHVRVLLKKHPLVRSFDRADSDDGGDAVTVVMLTI